MESRATLGEARDPSEMNFVILSTCGGWMWDTHQLINFVTVNYSGTQSFITSMLDYSLANKLWVLSSNFDTLVPITKVQTLKLIILEGATLCIIIGDAYGHLSYPLRSLYHL